MKRFFGCMIMAILIVGLMGFGRSIVFGPGKCLAADSGPVIMMGTPLVKISKKVNVVIMGSGFKPGQEVTIVITTKDGQQTDIVHALKPAPKADATGTWATTWSADRFVSRKVIPPGPCKITATDDEYNPIAHSVVFFEKAAEKKKK